MQHIDLSYDIHKSRILKRKNLKIKTQKCSKYSLSKTTESSFTSQHYTGPTPNSHTSDSRTFLLMHQHPDFKAYLSKKESKYGDMLLTEQNKIWPCFIHSINRPIRTHMSLIYSTWVFKRFLFATEKKKQFKEESKDNQ